MAQECNRWFYKTQGWKTTATAYKKSQQNLCERCRAKGLIVPGEIVHHKIHLTADNVNDETISLNWDNLELLCRKCHGLEHNNKRYTVNELGEVII